MFISGTETTKTIIMICLTVFLGSCDFISQQIGEKSAKESKDQESTENLETKENSNKPLQPLTVGNTWTYKVETEDDNYSMITEVTNVKPNELGGREFQLRDLSSNKSKVHPYRVIANKNKFRFIFSSNLIYLFKKNTNQNYQYTEPGIEGEVKVKVSKEEVSLPVGDFQGIKYKFSNFNTTWVFVRGIGLVYYRSHTEKGEPKNELTLQRYNLK